MITEYLTLLAQPPAAWWAELEQQVAEAGIMLERERGESVGRLY
ncbi:hypothetical protein [Deinococcus piscis]|nr:hypothetical protein [Deinococcus piscis]